MNRRASCWRGALAGPVAALGFAVAGTTCANAQTAPTQPAPQPVPQPVPGPPATPNGDRPAIKSVFASGSTSFVELRGEDRTWSLTSGGVAFNTSATGVTTAEVQRTARPGLKNVRGALRHDEQLSKDTSVYVQASASSGDPLREDWGVSAGIVQRISAHLQLTLDARAARYSTPDPAALRPSFVGLAVIPGVVLSPRGTPIEFAAQAIVLRNERKEWQVGGAVRALYYTGDRDYFIAGASRYPENELGVVRQLSSFFVGMRRELGQGIGLRFTAEQARLEGTWTARTISVGLEKRF